MAETVYTLTENDSIHFVEFEMNIGSHANPGVYSREDYEKILIKGKHSVNPVYEFTFSEFFRFFSEKL